MKKNDNNLNKDINILNLLKKYKFKKRILEDNSGFWYEKKVGKYFVYYVDIDTNHYELTSNNEGIVIKFKSLSKLIKSLDKFKFKY